MLMIKIDKIVKIAVWFFFLFISKTTDLYLVQIIWIKCHPIFGWKKKYISQMSPAVSNCFTPEFLKWTIPSLNWNKPIISIRSVRQKSRTKIENSIMTSFKHEMQTVWIMMRWLTEQSHLDLHYLQSLLWCRKGKTRQVNHLCNPNVLEDPKA